MPQFATSRLSQVESVDGFSDRGESFFNCQKAMQFPLGTVGSTRYNPSARRFQQNCSMFRKDLREENPMMDIWTEKEELCSRLKAVSALGNVGLSPDPPQLHIEGSSVSENEQKEVLRELHAPFRELFLAEEEGLSRLSMTYESLKSRRVSTAKSRQDIEPSLDEDTAAIMEIQKSLCSAVGAIEEGWGAFSQQLTRRLSKAL